MLSTHCMCLAACSQHTADQRRLACVQGRLVLLAEDNLINQRVAKMMLSSLGMTVEVVSNGQEAVDAVKRRTGRDGVRQFDVLLMDMAMPVMGGVDATKVGSVLYQMGLCTVDVLLTVVDFNVTAAVDATISEMHVTLFSKGSTDLLAIKSQFVQYYSYHAGHHSRRAMYDVTHVTVCTILLVSCRTSLKSCYI